MRQFLAGTSNCASALAGTLVAASIIVSSASDVALSDASDASLDAAPPAPGCGSNELALEHSNPPSASEQACADTPRTPEEVAEARAYLIETASPGYTMTLQGAELALGRLHPEFAVRLERAIREARSAGLPFASVFSAYRPPAFGVGGFSDKFNSLHTYGLAVDMRGIGSPGSPEAQLWHRIAAKNGVVCPYGPRDRAEWNHCQPTSVKIILAQNPLRETVTSAGPVDVESMFEAGNPLIEDVASAADSLSRAAPTPLRALEASAKGPEQTMQVAAREQTKRDTERVAAKLARHAKLKRVAAKSARHAKAERHAAKSGRPAKAERIVITSAQPPKVERIVVKSSQPAKAERIAAKSGQQAKTQRVAAKSAQQAKTQRVAAKSSEHAKSERAAAKSAQNAKVGQRRGGGRSLGAKEANQKPKSKKA
jgi:chemotaxis protein histidine kinase CheA